MIIGVLLIILIAACVFIAAIPVGFIAAMAAGPVVILGALLFGMFI
jgi:hypothetical protein